MTASGANLTPGEMLSSARDQASLSLEQVAESTRIPLNMLQAIEQDEYHKISGDLYVKSFLRAFCQAVALDPDEVVEVYLAFTGAVSKEAEIAGQASWNEQDVKIKRVGLPWGWILFLGLAVVIAGVSFFWAGREEPTLQQNLGEELAGTDRNTESSLGSVARDSNVPAPAPRGEAPNDTLALGWQLENPTRRQPALIPPASESEADLARLPAARIGGTQIAFQGGRHWPYVLRLTTSEIGVYSVKRDAETSFTRAYFPASEAEILPLPQGELVAGRAYAVQEGFVVYWGLEDHLSLRLGKVQGVSVSFNGINQELGRYRDGEEILLDSSRLRNPVGN